MYYVEIDKSSNIIDFNKYAAKKAELKTEVPSKNIIKERDSKLIQLNADAYVNHDAININNLIEISTEARNYFKDLLTQLDNQTLIELNDSALSIVGGELPENSTVEFEVAGQNYKVDNSVNESNIFELSSIINEVLQDKTDI